ncbi:hypothetical protein MJO28_004913 [Puccinia striiformis f. sp. tritici]|uniref:Uncharacterized protein n=1 Tax=Puccinia striiformis f. sp. tritici TaxID=168172 RepID=A0ACC0EIS4_9BASI|nr:hypothetical protein MJO28_004913 [Puccinia striiformis f. sp. tritici]
MQFPTTTIVLLAVSGLATAAVPVINRFYCNHDQPHGFCGVKLQNKQWFSESNQLPVISEPLTFDRCGFGKSDFCGDDYMVYLVQVREYPVMPARISANHPPKSKSKPLTTRDVYIFDFRTKMAPPEWRMTNNLRITALCNRYETLDVNNNNIQHRKYNKFYVRTSSLYYPRPIGVTEQIQLVSVVRSLSVYFSLPDWPKRIDYAFLLDLRSI